MKAIILISIVIANVIGSINALVLSSKMSYINELNDMGLQISGGGNSDAAIVISLVHMAVATLLFTQIKK